MTLRQILLVAELSKYTFYVEMISLICLNSIYWTRSSWIFVSIHLANLLTQFLNKTSLLFLSLFSFPFLL